MIRIQYFLPCRKKGKNKKSVKSCESCLVKKHGFFLPKADRVFSLPSGKGEILEQILKILLILSENTPEALAWPLLGAFLMPQVLLVDLIESTALGGR